MKQVNLILLIMLFNVGTVLSQNSDKEGEIKFTNDKGCSYTLLYGIRETNLGYNWLRFRLLNSSCDTSIKSQYWLKFEYKCPADLKWIEYNAAELSFNKWQENIFCVDFLPSFRIKELEIITKSGTEKYYSNFEKLQQNNIFSNETNNTNSNYFIEKIDRVLNSDITECDKLNQLTKISWEIREDKTRSHDELDDAFQYVLEKSAKQKVKCDNNAKNNIEGEWKIEHKASILWKGDGKCNEYNKYSKEIIKTCYCNIKILSEDKIYVSTTCDGFSNECEYLRIMKNKFSSLRKSPDGKADINEILIFLEQKIQIETSIERKEGNCISYYKGYGNGEKIK